MHVAPPGPHAHSRRGWRAQAARGTAGPQRPWPLWWLHAHSRAGPPRLLPKGEGGRDLPFVTEGQVSVTLIGQDHEERLVDEKGSQRHHRTTAVPGRPQEQVQLDERAISFKLPVP